MVSRCEVTEARHVCVDERLSVECMLRTQSRGLCDE